MHISEGVLSFPTLASGAALSAVGIFIGLKKLESKKLVQSAVLAASFFVASLIHIPIVFGSVHLLLNGIVGLLSGFTAFPIIFIALFLQGIFFQFGGITTLGVNTFIMAAPCVLSFYIFSSFIKRGKCLFVVSFLCGFLSVFVSGLLLSFALITTDEKFFKVAMIVFSSHIPVMILEGFITAFCIQFLKKMERL